MLQGLSWPLKLTQNSARHLPQLIQFSSCVLTRSGKLIFRDEWKPTPRFRSSPSQPAAPTAGYALLVPLVLKVPFCSYHSIRAHSPSHSWITIQSGSNVYRVPLPNWLDSFSTPDSPAAPVSESAHAPALPPASVSEPVSAPVSSPPYKPAGLPTPSVLEVEPEPQGFVARLLKDNDDVYNKLINHPFPQSLGNGSASLDGFRYYMIVSYLLRLHLDHLFTPNSNRVARHKVFRALCPLEDACCCPFARFQGHRGLRLTS